MGTPLAGIVYYGLMKANESEESEESPGIGSGEGVPKCLNKLEALFQWGVVPENPFLVGILDLSPSTNGNHYCSFF